MRTEDVRSDRLEEAEPSHEELTESLGDDFMSKGQYEQALYVYGQLRNREKLILLGDECVSQSRQLYLAAEAFAKAEAFDKLSRVGDLYRDGGWFEMARDTYIRAHDWQSLSALLKGGLDA
jgi:hypothetical protein